MDVPPRLLYTWKLPPKPPEKLSPRAESQPVIAGIVVAVDALSVLLVAGMGPLPFLARFAVGGAIALICISGESEEDYLKRVQAWKEQQSASEKAAPPLRLDLTATNEVELLALHNQFANGEFSPASEIRVPGKYGQQLKTTYGAFITANKQPKRKHFEFAAKLVEVGKKVDKIARGNVFEALKVIKVTFEYFSDDAELQHKRAILHHEVSADIVGNFVFNGMNIVSNDGQNLVLRWGNREESDIKIKRPKDA